MLYGRFINGADEDNIFRSAVIGQDLARDYQYLPVRHGQLMSTAKLTEW